MLKWLKKDPKKKLEAEYQRKMEEARNIQRSGDLRKYAALISEAEALLERIKNLD